MKDEKQCETVRKLSLLSFLTCAFTNYRSRTRPVICCHGHVCWSFKAGLQQRSTLPRTNNKPAELRWTSQNRCYSCERSVTFADLCYCLIIRWWRWRPPLLPCEPRPKPSIWGWLRWRRLLNRGGESGSQRPERVRRKLQNCTERKHALKSKRLFTPNVHLVKKCVSR